MGGGVKRANCKKRGEVCMGGVLIAMLKKQKDDNKERDGQIWLILKSC